MNARESVAQCPSFSQGHTQAVSWQLTCMFVCNRINLVKHTAHCTLLLSTCWHSGIIIPDFCHWLIRKSLIFARIPAMAMEGPLTCKYIWYKLLKHGHQWKLIQRNWRTFIWRTSILWYEFVMNVKVATLSQLPSTNEAISRRRHSLWPRQAYGSGCSCPPSHTSLSHVTTGLRTIWHLEETTMKMLGGAGHHEHRALFLMLGVLWPIGQHGGCYDPSTVKRR